MKKFFEKFLINGNANLLIQVVISSILYFGAFALIIIGLTLGIDEYAMIVCVFFFSPILTFVTLIIQIKYGTLVLPKKQLLEKVISFNPAIEKLDIPNITNSIDFIKNNKIKMYLVDNPFIRKEETRQNCYVRFIYYTVETTYFNKGKFEQYIGQNRLCFDYSDFLKYEDELKNYKEEIKNNFIENNDRKHADEIYKIKSDNNKREQEIKEEYEKKLQDMQDTINKKDNQLQEEITARENYKNKFLDCELKNKELNAKIQEMQSKEMSDIKRYISRSSYYFFMSRTNQELQEKDSDRTYTNKEIKKYFWNVINRNSDNFPNLKKEMKQLLKRDIIDEQNPDKFPSWAENYIKSIFEQRQTKGGRPRKNL